MADVEACLAHLGGSMVVGSFLQFRLFRALQICWLLRRNITFSPLLFFTTGAKRTERLVAPEAQAEA